MVLGIENISNQALILNDFILFKLSQIQVKLPNIRNYSTENSSYIRAKIRYIGVWKNINACIIFSFKFCFL